jgi:hypothetical protein
MKRIILLLTGAMSLFYFVASAQNPNLGTSGAQFLKIPVGPRATAMGGAFVSNADDASALFWNPSGITAVKQSELFASYTSWWAGISVSQAAFVHSFEDFGTVGVSMNLLSMGDMEVTTEQDPEGTGQKFTASDLMLGASYARRLTEDFSVGITLKIVNQQIWNESATGIAFDVGTQYRIGFRDLTIGMSMSNFGADMKYDGRDLAVKYDSDTQNPGNRLAPAQLGTEDYPLPLFFQVGVSISPYVSDDISVLVATDVSHPNDNKERVNVGVEFSFLKQFYLRGGYRFGYDTERGTIGGGVKLPLEGLNLTVDYAYAMYDLLPNISRFSIGMTF